MGLLRRPPRRAKLQVAVADGRKPPWYRQTEVIDRACAYMQAYVDLEDEADQHAQIESHQGDALTRLIFESNTFEQAGLPEAETRAVLEELGIRPIPRWRRSGQVYDLVVGGELLRLLEMAIPEPEALTVRFRARSRAWREVVQHYYAWAAMERAVLSQHLIFLLHRGYIGGFVAPVQFFLATAFLRKVHGLLSRDLLPEDAKVAAGEYRIDHRIAGLATGFVAPQLIAEAMRRLEADAVADFDLDNKPVFSAVFELAARFSHRITSIHPFPDFNGRLSRLVLSASLSWGSVPFPVSIKFDKKGRERYLYALRKGDKGDLRPMTVLVARAVVDGFEAIDAKLELAGLPRLLPAADA